MQTRVLKWGNSDAVRIPKVILKELNLTTNDAINIEKDGDRIIITKVSRGYKTLEERFENYHGNYKPTEIDWGKPVGVEIW